MLLPSFLTLTLALPSVLAQKPRPGSFVVAGDTLVSAMMVCLDIFFCVHASHQAQMFLSSSGKVYILDKVEGNAHQINGHSLYASVW
jgi:hypothetical protein